MNHATILGYVLWIKERSQWLYLLIIVFVYDGMNIISFNKHFNLSIGIEVKHATIAG